MRADIVPGGTFPDYELTDHTKTRRRLSELQGIDPMIPYTLVLKPGLVIYSVYNGYWFWGRPSFEDLRRDLREVTREIRPDWDLAAPGLRENWESGDHSMHHPYQAGHGRSPSAADSPSAAAVPGGA
ncbi:MAG: hypothetical protein ACLQB1_05800 [Streptosporangiaceae bacterium]|jgi:hypothetical protein